MKYIKKIFSVIRNVKETAQQVDCSKWSQFLIFFDVIYCRLIYHATYKEYLMYRFYNYKNRYRKNFFLKYHQRNEFKKINTGTAFTKSKYGFYSKIPECFSREMIITSESGEQGFVDFAKKHGKIVVKPNGGSLGKGISIFTYTDDEQARKFYADFYKDMICEEFIQQHDGMNALNPYSVNSLRIVTFLTDGEVKIIAAILRTGSKSGVFVDNMCSDGIGAQIEISTGIVSTHGFDYHDNTYIKHPVSGVQFLGFNIPNWDEAIQRVTQAHKKLPECRIFGWDIAITQSGVDIIEANNRPGVPIMQMEDLKPRGAEVLAVTRRIKKKKAKNKRNRKCAAQTQTLSAK